MAPLKDIFKAVEKFTVDNSPGILTGLGVAGSVATAILVGREAYLVGMDASTQYHEALREGEPLPEHLLTRKHIVKTYWKGFIPAVVMGTTTVACVVTANRVGSRRAAAVAAAFKISEGLATEYRDRVVEVLGKKQEQALRDKLEADRVERTVGGDVIIVAGSGAVFFDTWSGRYFASDMETVRRSVNDINHKVNNNYYASLTEFYELIGLEATEMSDEFGWNANELLEVYYSTVLMKDGRPAVTITFNKSPIRGYARIN